MPEPVRNPEVEFIKKRMPDSVKSDLEHYRVPVDLLLQMSVVEIYDAFQSRILAYYHDKDAYRSASNVLGYLFTMDCFLRYRTPLDVIAIEQIFPDLATTAVAALRNYCVSAPSLNPNLEGLKRVFELSGAHLSNQYDQRKAAQDERERRLTELENKVNAQLEAIEKLNDAIQSAVRPSDPLDIGSDPILDAPIGTLDLTGIKAPERILNSLYCRSDIRTVRDLTKYTRRELLAIRGIGPTCIKVIEHALACHNLKLIP